MWQFDKFTNTFIPGTLPADGSKITACYDRLSQEDEQEGAEGEEACVHGHRLMWRQS